MNALVQYDWPGNIRELENTIERAFIMESGSHICLPSLPDNLSGSPLDDSTVANSPRSGAGARQGATAGSGFIQDGEALNFPALKDRFEREFIIKALRTYRGKINQTAEATQMTKVTLLRKMEKFGIDPKEFYTLG